jgi:hypothetical protein
MAGGHEIILLAPSLFHGSEMSITHELLIFLLDFGEPKFVTLASRFLWSSLRVTIQRWSCGLEVARPERENWSLGVLSSAEVPVTH